MKPQEEEYTDADDDIDILTGLSRKVLDSPEGAQALVAAAQNTESPAKGAGQFVIMLIENVSTALADSGIDVDAAAWLADDGVLAELTDDIIGVLEVGGLQLDADKFAEELYYVVADMAKGISQAEEAQGATQPTASPTAGASDMLAQAPLLS